MFVSDKGRSAYIDALRGFAIVLVVLGHVTQRATGAPDFFYGPGPVHLTLNSVTAVLFSFRFWHMPLFMAISGYLTWGHVREPIERWLGVKAQQLLVPFVAWTAVLFWVPDKFVGRHGDWLTSTWFSITHPGNTLWYLFVLFVFYVIAALASRSPLGDWTLAVAGFVIMVLPAGLWSVGEMQNVYWWFVFGYLCARFSERCESWRVYAIAAGALAFPLLLRFYGHEKMLVLLGPLRLSAILGSLLLVWVVIKLRAGWPLVFLGRRTLEIYACHFLFINLPLADGIWRIPLVTITAIGLSLLLGALLQRWRWTDLVFFGGRRVRSAPAPVA